MKTSVFKKATALVLILMMMFSVVITAVSATDAATLTIDVEDKEYKAGDEVTVTVSASALNAQALGLLFTYDDAVFESKSGNWTVEGTVFADYDAAKKASAMSFDEAEAKDIEGAIFTLVLTVKAGAEDGSYVINVTPMAKAVGGDAVDCAEGAATVVVVNEVECTHEYDNDCDADCNLCGEAREVADHTYETKFDELSHWKECAVCEDKIDVAAHEFDNDCDPDCACGYTRDIEHNYETKFDANGHWKECACGEKTEATAHVYGEWNVTVEPGKTTTGTKVRNCACGYSEEKVIPQTLRFASRQLTLESSIKVTYKVEGATFKSYGYTDAYVIFELNGKTTKVTDYTIEASTGRYLFDFTEMAPNNMGDVIEATLYANNNGEQYVSKTQTWSILQYCEGQFASTTNAELRTLLVELLNYGAAAQIYTNRNTNNLVNAGLTEEQKSWGIAETPTLTDSQNHKFKVIDNPTVAWKSLGLYLQDAVTVQFRFEVADMSGLTIKIRSGGNSWSIPCVVDGKVITAHTTANQYYLNFSGLDAGMMRNIFYVTVEDENGNVVSNTVQYSIESYAARNAGTEGKLKDLLIAMMKYGDAAYSYKY